MKRVKTVIILCFLVGCGSRKVTKQNDKIDISKTEQLESIGAVKKDVFIDDCANISVITYSNYFTVKPIDNTKPMTVGGQVFTNADVTIKNKQTKKTEQTNKKKTDHSEINVQQHQDSKTNISESFKKKDTERKMNYYWLWLLLVPLVVVGYQEYKKHKYNKD